MKIVLHDDHGGEHDVTEYIRSIYAHATGSMDWGSGFLDTDEMLEVQEFGYLSGFEQDIDGEIEDAASELSKYREWSEIPGRGNAYQKDIAEKEKWLAGLQTIRDARTRLFHQTDDVTDFDEEQK